MAERLMVIPLSEIKGIATECACGTGFTFTLAKPENINPDDREIPKNCPICGNSMGDAFLAARKLWDFYVTAQQIKTVTLRVTAAGNEAGAKV